MASGAAAQLDRLAADREAAQAVASARAAVDRLLAHRVLLRSSGRVAAESALRSARASAALEGVDLDLAALRHGSADPVVQGALRVAAGIGELVGVVRRAPLQAVARLHVLAAAGVLPAAELGRPATGSDTPRLVAAARACSSSTAPALLVAAVAHAEVVASGAFPVAAETGPTGRRPGDAARPAPPTGGMVARGLARLILVERGLDPKAVVAVDVGHAADPACYAASLAAYRASEPVPFVLHLCRAVEAAVQESLAVCEALRRG